jgi:Flp pilus assembly protein TadB
MAQTKKKRRRKHRGTQAGNIERAGRTGRPSGGRPASKAQARDVARQNRLDKEPTWRGSVNRAAFASVILAIFISVVQKNVPAGIVLGIVAMIVYIPMSYYTDRALWRRRQRQKQQRGR